MFSRVWSVLIATRSFVATIVLLVNSSPSSAIVAVGSPSNSSTTFARPSTATLMVRASGPVNSRTALNARRSITLVATLAMLDAGPAACPSSKS